MAAVVCKPLFFFCLSQAVRKKSAANRRKHGVSFAEAKTALKKHYDFSKSVRNPYLSKAKKQLPIRVDEDTIAYFKSLAEKNGIPYQNLINLYLRECAESGKTLAMKWG